MRRMGLLLLAVVMLCASPLVAAETAQKSIRTGGESPWTLNADRLVSLDDGVIVEAYGNVLLQRGSDYLKADFIRYYTTSNWMYLKGNVEARMGRDMLNAVEAEFDVNARTGWLKDGAIFVAGPHMYISGETIDKIFGDRYVFKNAKVTGCDGDVPAWSLSAELAEVEIDGYAKLYHSTVNIMDQAVMGLPIMGLPVKVSRQSGLLYPDFGYSSMNGAFYSQPYYQVIDQSRDITFTGTYMGKVGFMPGIQYRSQTRPNEKTWLALDLLYDTHTFTSDRDDPVNNTDRKVNTNEERYWLRGMGDGSLGDSGWRYRYNLDYVSDQNFLRQFRDMSTGFNISRDTTYDMFGRDFREVDKNRVSEGMVYKEWDNFMVSLGFRYEQDPSLGHGNTHHSEDTTVQSIPVGLYFFKRRLWDDIPLEAQAEVSTTYEYREKGVRGLRTEIHPELTLPMYLPGVSLLFNGGVRETFYNSNSVTLKTNDNSTRGSGNRNRTLPDVSVEAFTQFSRVWDMSERALEPVAENVGESAITGVRHRLQPRLTYAWTPEVDQSMNPYFEGTDRIKPSQTLRLSFTNIFTSRNSAISGANGVYNERVNYKDFLRWEMAIGYDFEEAKRSKFREVYPRRPITDFYSSLEFSPATWFSVWNRTYMSVYGEGITRSDAGVRLRNKRWGFWSISYNMRNKYYNYLEEMKLDSLSDMKFSSKQNYITNTVSVTPLKKIRLTYLTKDNLLTGENYERRFIVGYYHQCFHLLGAIHTSGRNNSYRVILELPGVNF